MLRVLLVLALLSGSRLFAQQDIRHVDFKNLTYPLRGSLLGHESLEWLSPSASASPERKPIHLVNGHASYRGGQFTYDSVIYADLTHDGHDEAIVVLTYFTGGTQTTNYVYVFTSRQHGPALLAYCHTGNRALQGLYGVDSKNGLLTFELFDPAKASGDCCSSGLLIYRYQWTNAAFGLAGPVEHKALPPPEEHSTR